MFRVLPLERSGLDPIGTGSSPSVRWARPVDGRRTSVPPSTRRGTVVEGLRRGRGVPSTLQVQGP